MAKVMISLPEEFLRRVDRLARAQGRSRSEIVREALRAHMTGHAATRADWKAVLTPLRRLEEHWVGQWNSTDIIRYYRENRYGRKDRD